MQQGRIIGHNGGGYGKQHFQRLSFGQMVIAILLRQLEISPWPPLLLRLAL